MPSVDPVQPPHDEASAELPEASRVAGHGDEAGLPEPDELDPEHRPVEQAVSELIPEGWALVALLPYDGHEPPAGSADELARAVWCAVSALWHPAILARATALPRIEPIVSPSPAAAREIRVIPRGSWDLLPSGYRTAAEDAGTVLIEADGDRAELVRQIRDRLGAPDCNTADQPADSSAAGAARDFLALGTVRWMLRELNTAMGHADLLDVESLTRELLAGAQAWQIGDWPGSISRLRAAFEVLTQARERFYPVDAYWIDICLLDPSMGEGALINPLAAPVAVTFLAQAQAIENQASRDPERIRALRQAIGDGWADVAGGTYAEAEDPLLPLESILWQFRQGASIYRAHLDDRSAETYARRRFGLYSQLPQIAKRFGFRFALHLGFDAGRFPIPGETKRLWESPDGSSLESLMLPPLAADRPSQGWILPWRLALTMKNDHVAALSLVHWPQPVAEWYLDLRRVATYSPVLGRWTTLNDFFHHSDRPYEAFRPESDLYVTPYLQQAVAKRALQPITQLLRRHHFRARLETASAFGAFADAIRTASGSSHHAERDDYHTEPESSYHAPRDGETIAHHAERDDYRTEESGDQHEPGSSHHAPRHGGTIAHHAERDDYHRLEALLETGRYSEVERELGGAVATLAEALANQLLTVASRPGSEEASASSPHRPGYLVLNPLGLSRRAAVILPDAALDLKAEGPLRTAQFTDEGVYGVVDLPSFGFAWVPRQSDPANAAASKPALSARDHQIRNELMEVEIDTATGGIRRVSAVGESSARLGQQLVVAGLEPAAGKPAASQMRSERFEIDYAGPAIVQATSSGGLFETARGNRLASFVERYRLWAGRPILEIEITLSDIDTGWLARAQEADPYTLYLACRWAWPDPNSMTRRLVFSAPELTEVERPESPEAFDISTRTQRTALLFGGLCYHRKHGSRMLDSIILAGGETTRTFRLGVVLDLEHPFHATLDFITPAVVVPTDLGPPAIGATGWLARIDHKSIAVTHVGFLPQDGDDRGWGLIFHLLETSGQSCRGRLRLFRNPTRARQVDFQGETIIDLTVLDDAVQIDLTPHELARIVVTLG
jgi:alpha-mannosidase